MSGSRLHHHGQVPSRRPVCPTITRDAVSSLCLVTRTCGERRPLPFERLPANRMVRAWLWHHQPLGARIFTVLIRPSSRGAIGDRKIRLPLPEHCVKLCSAKSNLPTHPESFITAVHRWSRHRLISFRVLSSSDTCQGRGFLSSTTRFLRRYLRILVWAVAMYLPGKLSLTTPAVPSRINLGKGERRYRRSGVPKRRAGTVSPDPPLALSPPRFPNRGLG